MTDIKLNEDFDDKRSVAISFTVGSKNYLCSVPNSFLKDGSISDDLLKKVVVSEMIHSLIANTPTSAGLDSYTYDTTNNALLLNTGPNTGSNPVGQGLDQMTGQAIAAGSQLLKDVGQLASAVGNNAPGVLDALGSGFSLLFQVLGALA